MEDFNWKNRCILLKNIPVFFNWTEFKILLFRADVIPFIKYINQSSALLVFENSNIAKKMLGILTQNDLQISVLQLSQLDNLDECENINLNSQLKEIENNTKCLFTSESENFSQTLKFDQSLQSQIFIANIDKFINENLLFNIFQRAGKIFSLQLIKKRNKKDHFYAFIEYEHPNDALRAIQMFDKQLLYNKKITVQLKKKPNLPIGLKSVGMGLGENGKPLKNIKKLYVEHDFQAHYNYNNNDQGINYNTISQCTISVKEDNISSDMMNSSEMNEFIRTELAKDSIQRWNNSNEVTSERISKVTFRK